MKKRIILAALACLSLGLASCNGGGGNPSPSTNANPSEVTPSSANSGSLAEASEEEKNFVTPEVTGPKKSILVKLGK